MANKAQFTILMVDDDEDEVFITRKLFRRSGIVNDFISERKPERLFSALSNVHENGSAAENVIILLDINMPRQDGFETLGKIRENPTYKDVPVIMLSASDNENDMELASELGANGYLVKPFSGEAFFAALDSVPQIRHQLVFGA